MKYNFNNTDDITINYRGCSLLISDSPHPSMQKWKLKYHGIESEGIDPILFKIVEIIFSEEGVNFRLKTEQEINLKKYLDEFIDRKINFFPFK
jgi:hypothetical protein